MAKLDQSFIKAYGQVGVRPAARSGGGSRETHPAAPVVISAAPIVIDAGSFSVDSCDVSPSSTCDAKSASQHRFEPAAAKPAAAPRPHVLRPTLETSRVAQVEQHEEAVPVASGRAHNRASKRSAANIPAVSALPVTTFQADSLSVDTFAAETPKPVVAKPKPKPVAKKTPETLCHRACTVQFSTVNDIVADETDLCDEELIIEDEDFEEVHVAEISLASHSVATHAIEPAPQHQINHRSATTAAPASPRVDGAAYHRVAPAAKPVHQASLRAGYEVDAFRWPEVVNGLSSRATTALSTLIDELVDASSDGRGVIMFAGERRGAGATTLAVYAARRMAELGLSVALVDADFGKPTLARSLGVAVEFGWDDAVDAESDFAAAMIASLEDGVAILPCRQSTPNINGARAARLAADLATLRKHFALVLIDGGPLNEVAEPWLKHAPEDTIDCGIVVRDVRLDAGRAGTHRPHAPHTTYPAIGVVENFVAEKAK